jgi:hypothetical protein
MSDGAVRLVLYSTSVPTLPKVRADIATIRRILDAKRVTYEEVDGAMGAVPAVLHSVSERRCRFGRAQPTGSRAQQPTRSQSPRRMAPAAMAD